MSSIDNDSYCKNCNSKLAGKYCNVCGQRSSVHKITFRDTFQDLIETVFSVNTPLWITLQMLIINPGKLFREYLEGKRRTYYKPVAFFILTTIVYIVLRSLIGYDPMGNTVIEQNDKLDVNLFMAAGKFMVANINNILFLFVFSSGLSLKLFFYKKYSLAEYLAISFYLVGIYNLLGAIFMFYLQFVNPELKFLPALLMLFYMVYALTSFYADRKFLVTVKTILFYFLAYFFYVAFGYGLSFLIVWLKNI
ncbi:MAG: DUF3667 domain-containing protein [Aureibaculum sp.]